ncbi:hypothetical protein [Micromonospora gifhornensis]|uniref:hypothetical protein n=1 Tax=Micromonospora gifhornensis TaxID=84594 RepID=UPI003D731590
MEMRDEDFEQLLKSSSLGMSNAPLGQRSQLDHIETVRRIVELRRRMSCALQPSDSDAAAIELSQLLRELGYEGQAEQVMVDAFPGPVAGPDEPAAVVFVGPRLGGRRGLIGALLGVPAPEPPVPVGGFLVFRHGYEASSVAFTPGTRGPQLYHEDPPNSSPPRPPRRVELSLPNSLLRHFVIVDTPDTETLGWAGRKVVLDAARRGGALVYVTSADQSPSSADLGLLAEIAQAPVTPYFVVTPSVDDNWLPIDRTAEHDGFNPTVIARDACRIALLSAVPTLNDARWFTMESDSDDIAQLRRALVAWAGDEHLRRVNRNSHTVFGATQPCIRSRKVQGADQFGENLQACARRIRQEVSLEISRLHLRCVQRLLFGDGHSGFPEFLDCELQALALFVRAACSRGVATLVQRWPTYFLAEAAPGDDAQRWPTTGEHQASHYSWQSDTLLIVTSEAGIASMVGPGVVTGIAASSDDFGDLLPTIDLALSGGCYQAWRNFDRIDTGAARAWVQRVLREVERELSRAIARQFEMLRFVLTSAQADRVGVPGPDDSRPMIDSVVDAEAHSVAGDASTHPDRQGSAARS